MSWNRRSSVFSTTLTTKALDRGEATIRAMPWEWYSYAQLYALNVGGTVIPVVDAWDQWFLDSMKTRMLATRDWLLAWATDGLSHYQGSTDPVGQVVEAVCALYIDRAHEFGGFNDETYPRGTPLRRHKFQKLDSDHVRKVQSSYIYLPVV